MINEDTPYKLAEIIRDTWPNLFRKPLTKVVKCDTINMLRSEEMKDFFNELNDRLQHKEQLSRKNARSSSELKYAEGISSARSIINELKSKYNL